MKKIILLSLGLLVSNVNANVDDFLVKKTYSVSYNETPHYKEIVNQHLVKKVKGYQKGWYFCGQSAWATAFNILRSDRNANKVKQLEYFHKKLSKYASYANSYRKEADGNLLAKITNGRSDFKVLHKTTTSRKYAKSYLHEALVSSKHQLPIVLSQLKVNGGTFGHFYVVYKVDYRDGGKVYYADPSTGRTGSMIYSNFLNGMKDAGTKGRYSFWIVRKK